MHQRTEFQTILESICPNVYFQPPGSIKMKYPCIVYSFAQERVFHGDNKHYAHYRRYDLILIDKNPDSEYIKEIESLPYSSYDRHYNADGLNHYVFEVYY